MQTTSQPTREGELTGIPYAQSSLPSHLPSNALDSNPATFWASSNYHAWWLEDLQFPCYLEEILVDTGTEDPICYYLETSLDHINWKTIGDTDPEGATRKTWKIGLEARYIRITFTYRAGGRPIQLSVVKAYGHPAAMPAAIWHVDGSAFYASSYAAMQQMERLEAFEMESGWNCTVMQTTTSGSYLSFDAIDFGQESNQLRAFFGLLNPNRALLVDLEIRLDSLDGTLIGTLQVFRQWKCWNDFACDIVPTSGRHTVYLIVRRIDEEQTLQLCHLRFTRSTPIVHEVAVSESIAQTDHYHAYLGLLHSHTCLSDGSNVPDYAYRYAREVGHLDFLAITEHSNLFDEPFDSAKSRKLRDLRRAAEHATENGRFVGLIGSETTWYNQFGHMNIYADDFYLNAYETKYNDVATYYETISKYTDVINQWNHPWSCGKRHLDYFEPYDPKVDQVMCLLEINHIEDPTCGGLSYFLKALNMGYHVAPCGSQDNHKEDWGTQNTLRTGILASELTKPHLLDAIHQRRVYFTCCPTLKLEYRVNGSIMGSRIAKQQLNTLQVNIEIGGQRTPLSQVQILGKDGRVVAEQQLGGFSAAIQLTAADANDPYLFVRVYCENGEFAVSSPVWIEA